MTDRPGKLRDAIAAVLRADDGLSIESEGTVFVRSLEGERYCAGTIADDGGIREETEFDQDLNAAISWFLSTRQRLNHGTC